MNPILRIISGIGFGLLIAELTGCFTEVGNPEEIRQMTAEFRVDYAPDTVTLGGSPDSVILASFNLTLKNAEYRNADSSRGYVWQDSPNHVVDFLGTLERDTLPLQNLTSKPVSGFRMDFALQEPGVLRADTVDFDAFQSGVYIKGTYRFGGSLTHFLYALSDSTRELSLVYSKQALDKWYQSGTYRCTILFSPLKWFSGVDLQRILVEKDKSGAPLTLFDPEHNLDAWLMLKDRFYQNFNTQQVYWDSLSPP